MKTISIIHVDVLEKVYVLLISAKQPTLTSFEQLYNFPSDTKTLAIAKHCFLWLHKIWSILQIKLISMHRTHEWNTRKYYDCDANNCLSQSWIELAKHDIEQQHMAGN